MLQKPSVYIQRSPNPGPLSLSLVPSGAPQDFAARGLGPNSIRLSWNPPAIDHRKGRIIMYEIMYSRRDNPLIVYDDNTTELFKVIDDLEPHTDYTFQIKAYTSKGAGPWSNHLPVKTYGQCE